MDQKPRASNLQFSVHEVFVDFGVAVHTLVKNLTEGIPHLNTAPEDHTFLSPVSLIDQRACDVIVTLKFSATMHILVLGRRQVWCTHGGELSRRRWVSKSICLCGFLGARSSSSASSASSSLLRSGSTGGRG